MFEALMALYVAFVILLPILVLKRALSKSKKRKTHRNNVVSLRPKQK